MDLRSNDRLYICAVYTVSCLGCLCFSYQIWNGYLWEIGNGRGKCYYRSL